MGLTFQPIRQRQLDAASGSTDFAGLFVGFSFFLIVAAALLVAMLFRLNIEQRARQLGLLVVDRVPSAIAPRLGTARRNDARVIGGLSVSPARSDTRGSWSRACERGGKAPSAPPRCSFTSSRRRLVIGLVSSLLVAFFAVLWGVWRVGRTPEARLLAGAWNDPSAARARKSGWATGIGISAVSLGVVLLDCRRGEAAIRPRALHGRRGVAAGRLPLAPGGAVAIASPRRLR